MEKPEMEEILKKAEVLIEALPYIQKFNRKIIVVKYGGSAMSNEELQKNVIKDVTLLKLVGFKPIIVHGGGKAISRWVEKSGKKAEFINGLRVTDEETMEIAEMVLGRVNKSLVSMVERLGVAAAGISGKDGGLLRVRKKYSDGQDIGFVGEVTSVAPKILYDLLEKDYLPIVAPVGLDEDCNTYNINADDAACANRYTYGADKLVFLTDVEGLYAVFQRQEQFHFPDQRGRCGGTDRGGRDRRRNAAQTGQLHVRDPKRRQPGTYPGRQDPSLPAARDFYGSRRGNCHRGRRGAFRKEERKGNPHPVEPAGEGAKRKNDSGMTRERKRNMSMMQQYIEEAERALLHTYNRYQVVLDKERVYIYTISRGKNIWTSRPESRFSRWAITIRTTTMRSKPRSIN